DPACSGSGYERVGQTGMSVLLELKGTIMGKLSRKAQVSGLALVALAILLPACTHRKIVTIGSHKVTVSRHGFEKKLQVNNQGALSTLEYAGVSTDGKGLKDSMQGDKITVNGVPRQLRPGDTVLISDDGVAVNSLDYGESAKYLQANDSGSQTSKQN